jgi:predicted RNase H-like nuclease (RuvC/YqgF family)
METKTQELIDNIRKIGNKIDDLTSKLLKQELQIENLKIQNEVLTKNNQSTIDQIKEYLKELEQIRNHYVNSNDNTL